MSLWWFAGVYFASFGVVMIFLCLRRKAEVQKSQIDNYRLLRYRLSAYALMQKPCANIYHPPITNVSFVHSAMLLSDDQHKILLGILKKAEAKSAVLVLAVIFAIPALEGLIWSFVRCSPLSSLMVMISAGIFTSLLAYGVRGAVHLGQPNFRELVANFDEPIWGRDLQRDLVHDMLRKEAVLDYTSWLGSVAFCFAVLAVLFRITQID